MIADAFKKLAKIAWMLPGFMLWAAYPPMGESVDCLFALAPLMWFARRGNARASAKWWFASGMVYWVATLSWMPAIVKNGGPWPLVVLGWGALSAYCSAYFAAYGYLSAKAWQWTGCIYWRRLLAIFVFEPVLWCGLELIRSRFAGGFAWNQLGVVPVNCGFGAPAALGGVYLLSAVVLLINGTIAGVAERVMRKVPRYAGIETIGVFAIIFAIYQVAEFMKTDLQGGESIKVAMIQRNFPCVFQAKEENPYSVYEKLLDNVAELKPDLVVMSESALSEFGAANGRNAAQFADFVRRKTSGGALLAGGTWRTESDIFNSAVLFDGETRQPYHKVHLVPFGEFIPGDKMFPVLQKLAPVGSCTPGKSHTVSFRGVPLGIAICFEDTDSAQVRELAKKGARALVFITNDSWFSRSKETVQHSWQSTARAIETGLPVIRVGNSGVTGTISPEGKATWLIGDDARALVDCRGTMFDRVQVGKRQNTVYVKVGDWPLMILFALLILGMILVKYKHYYEKRRYLSM